MAPRSSERWRWVRKNLLGVVTGGALVLLVVAYLAVLELSRPHVSGEELRYDTLVELAQSGRLVNAHVLDEDAYVVGSYIRETETFGAEPEPQPHNSPLIRGTQRDLLVLFLENRVPITVDQQVGKRVASLASILLPSLILVVLFVYLILSFRRGTGCSGSAAAPGASPPRRAAWPSPTSPARTPPSPSCAS